MVTKLLGVTAILIFEHSGDRLGQRQPADQIYCTYREHHEARCVHGL